MEKSNDIKILRYLRRGRNGFTLIVKRVRLSAFSEKLTGALERRKAKETDDDITDEIKKQFHNLDMMTTSAIAIMLCDTKSRAASPYLKGLKKPSIKTVMLGFCSDTYFADDIREIEKLFSKSYYKRKVKTHLGKVTGFVKKGISDSLPKGVSMSQARTQRNTFVDKICETIQNFEPVKYTPALSGNEELPESKKNYKLDHLNHMYKDALIYLVDVLLTCTCISKMLFVERMINKMEEQSEFYKIIRNMNKTMDNHNMIINKSRPLYKQYYRSELGYIHGDDLLYGFAITVMINRINKNSTGNSVALPTPDETADIRGFMPNMLVRLDKLAKRGYDGDVGTLILHRISTTIRDDFNLLTDALQELTSWENYYYQRVDYYKKEKDKIRYLSGDAD